MSLVAKGNQELVCTKLDVVAHHDQFHPNEFNREGINNKFHFNVDRTADDVNDACFRKAVDQFRVKQACEVTVEPIIVADEFVAGAEARHKSALCEPEYGAERDREENAFDSSKFNHTFGETGIGGEAPYESPVGFALGAWYYFNGMEQVHFLFWILDVHVD